MRDALNGIPAQYKQRASYDFIDGMFKVCAGGYGLASCEDSEVAHAICVLWNAVLDAELVRKAHEVGDEGGRLE